MKKVYQKLLFSQGSNHTLNDLDQSDIKFLFELMTESTQEEVIQFADNYDYL